MNDAHKPPLEVYSAEEAREIQAALAERQDVVAVGALVESGDSPDTGNAEETPTFSPLSPDSASACPTCGRKPPAPKKQSKLRGSKTIKVPKDAQEDGVELLETLIAQVEGDLRPNERPRSPYYTLIEALYFFLTNAKKAAA